MHKIADNFEIIEPLAEEIETGSPVEIAQNNAIIKGKSIKNECDVLLACDTLVALEGVIYGKPKTMQKAREMLKILNGKTHSVFSGVYLKVMGKEYTFTEESKVTFKQLTNEAIDAYVEEFKPLDKAGAYGIQDEVIVDSYKGDYDNIMGLPTLKIREILREYIDVKD